MFKKIRFNNKGQMMVLESVVFAITVIISLIFLYQLSPTSTQNVQQTSDLKIRGDLALQSLYNQELSDNDLPDNFPGEFPKNKLVYYLLTDGYTTLAGELSSMLPSTAKFNVFISNGTNKTWITSNFPGSNTPVTLVDPISVSHYFISIHPQFFNGSKFDIIDDGCEIAKQFGVYNDPSSGDYSIKEGYAISTYDIILEMSVR